MEMDRHDLADFVTAVGDILQQVVDWRGLLFRDELRGPIADAWDELRPILHNVKLIIAEREDIVSDEDLQKRGLTGKQLELKLKGFYSAWDRFRTLGGVQYLKKLLEWIDITLGSLASVIPGAEAIEEFKDSIKQSIEEDSKS